MTRIRCKTGEGRHGRPFCFSAAIRCLRFCQRRSVPPVKQRQSKLDTPQAAKSRETAGDRGCDESEQALDETLRVTARQKPTAPAAERTRVKDSHDLYANTATPTKAKKPGR